MDRKPLVCIFENDAKPELLKEVCAGLEEEGVLFGVFAQSEADVKTLAYNAAAQSLLNVGIGITMSGAVMQMKNFSIDKPIFNISGETGRDYRTLGANAARAVKGGVFV